MVTLRVYEDTRKMNAKNVDRFTIYFPVSKRNQSTDNDKKSYGLLLACNIAKNGRVTAYCWFAHTYKEHGPHINTNALYLGKKLKRNDLPKRAQRYINEFETAWNLVQDGNNAITFEQFAKYEPKP